VIERRVRIADYAVGRSGESIVTVGLGSCVAIVLYDARARVGSLAHCLLPESTTRGGELLNPAKFPGSIVPVMVAELRAMGSRGGGALVAKLVGGASMFRALMDRPGMNVGERNIMAARKALNSAGIRIASEEVGGEAGRSVRFSVADGSVLVKTVHGGERVL
jgi:chemotaxis protein CheD